MWQHISIFHNKSKERIRHVAEVFYLVKLSSPCSCEKRMSLKWKCRSQAWSTSWLLSLWNCQVPKSKNSCTIFSSTISQFVEISQLKLYPGASTTILQPNVGLVVAECRLITSFVIPFGYSDITVIFLFHFLDKSSAITTSAWMSWLFIEFGFHRV